MTKLKRKSPDVRIHPGEKRSKPQGRPNLTYHWGGLDHKEGLNLTEPKGDRLKEDLSSLPAKVYPQLKPLHRTTL